MSPPFFQETVTFSGKIQVIRFKILLCALLFATISFAGSPDEVKPTIKAEVALVNVVFSAFDRHDREVPGLNVGDFLVLEDRAPQMIQYFSTISKGDIPLTIALLIDTSSSVRDKLDFEKETAAEFLRGAIRQQRDSALVIQFNSEVDLVHDFSHNPEDLIAAMKPLRAGGSTALYDAVFRAVGEKLRNASGRKVIVVISDGEDTASMTSEEATIEAAQKSDVLIYGMGIRSEEYRADFRVLKRFAKETGGRFFSLRAVPGEMRQAFQLIDRELSNQYSLAYTSTNTNWDGTYRSIELRCKRGGVRIRARKGYYAPNSRGTSTVPD